MYAQLSLVLCLNTQNEDCPYQLYSNEEENRRRENEREEKRKERSLPTVSNIPESSIRSNKTHQVVFVIS